MGVLVLLPMLPGMISAVSTIGQEPWMYLVPVLGQHVLAGRAGGRPRGVVGLRDSRTDRGIVGGPADQDHDNALQDRADRVRAVISPGARGLRRRYRPNLRCPVLRSAQIRRRGVALDPRSRGRSVCGGVRSMSSLSTLSSGNRILVLRVTRISIRADEHRLAAAQPEHAAAASR